MTEMNAGGYILGLDIGSNSIGWAVLALDENTGRPAGLARVGARVFQDHVNQGFETGAEEPPGQKRREMRGQRRLLDRRKRRLYKLARILQDAGLFPADDMNSPEQRHQFFTNLDKRIADELKSTPGGLTPLPKPAMLPYLLRAQALDNKLPLHHLARALYHLAQRRGFKSNRLFAPKKDEEHKKVEPAISELENKIKASGSRTLGEYFSKIDPAKEEKHIRRNYTGRKMFQDEFKEIWSKQQVYYPDVLTDALKAVIDRAIFFQLPMKSSKHLIGKCELEPDRARAPWGLLAAQCFRLVQGVINARLVTPQHEIRELTPEQRAALIDALEENEEVTLTQAKDIIGVSRSHRFKIEKGGEKKFKGNKTAAALKAIFGDRWKTFDPREREALVEDLRSLKSKEALARRGMKAWGLSSEQAAKFAAIQLEKGYCRHSRQALAKLLPHMEAGVPYATAKLKEYGERPLPPPADTLPPVAKAIPELRNPVVSRALTEARKVVNNLIQVYGKPAEVRIELAREMKKSHKERENITLQNRKNQERRNAAKERIIKETPIAEPSQKDIEKLRLADECDFTCPYTGDRFSMAQLFSPAVEVEHIIPRSRCLDDSFSNKTLCFVSANRDKHNRTPYEAYGDQPDHWKEILDRVEGFKGDFRDAKLTRFRMKEEDAQLESFTHRQLNDTRYAATLARKYLGLLYGPAALNCVQVGRGDITGFLRGIWKLNFLGGGEKKRDDHRQHAVDAVVITLTDAKAFQDLGRAVDQAEKSGRERRIIFSPPWEGFQGQVREAVLTMIVSHRVTRKVSGPLHEETYYRGLGQEPGKVRIRKRLGSKQSGLTEAEIKRIIDCRVRKLVQEKLAALGEPNPQKAFADENNLPHLPNKNGRPVPIRKVRIEIPLTTFPLGKGMRQRYVVSKSNHHLEILETMNRRGQKQWEAAPPVTLHEAFRRSKTGEPIVKKDHGPDRRFLFTLAPGEIIELDQENGRVLFRVRSVSEGEIAFVSLTDARKKEDIKKSHQWGRKSANGLKELNCRKVVITPLGEVRRASD